MEVDKQSENACSTIATVEELEANNNQISSLKEGNTSFFKTFFNGANTIIGLFIDHPYSNLLFNYTIFGNNNLFIFYCNLQEMVL